MSYTQLKTIGLAVAAILLCSQGTAAQQPAKHWLIGWWQGDLQPAAGPTPSRVITVTSVAKDGTARGNMGLPGQNLAPAEIKVDGSKVHVVNAFKSVAEFTREGDDQLVGTVTAKDAKTGSRLALARVKLAEDHPLVGEWIGTWQRSTVGDNGQFYLTVIGVNGPSVVGEYRFSGRAMTWEKGFVGTLTGDSLAFGTMRFSVSGKQMTGSGSSEGQAASNISLMKK
jgi:hypothetical protein